MALRTGSARRLSLAGGCLGLLVAAAPKSTPAPILRLAVEGASNANAAIAAHANHVVVTWAARTPAGTDAYAAMSRDGGVSFEAPVRVNDTPGDARVSGEQAPRVGLGQGVHVLWGGRSGAAPVMRSATARPGESRFRPAALVHGEGLTGLRGWGSLAVTPRGTLHVAWLDGRANAALSQTPATGAARRATRQDLYHAARDPDGKWRETRVASDVCFCCKTAIAAGEDGSVYVAWRHVYPPNVRDVAVARSGDGGRTFGPPVRVSADGWALDGCPDDGPSLALDGRGALHIAWPTTVASGGKGVFYAFSTDGGRSFAPRLRVDEAGGTAAHPQLAARDGRLLIAWEERGAGAARVRLRALTTAANARAWTPQLAPRITTLGGVGAATYPAVAASHGAALVAWTEEAADGALAIGIQRVVLP